MFKLGSHQLYMFHTPPVRTLNQSLNPISGFKPRPELHKFKTPPTNYYTYFSVVGQPYFHADWWGENRRATLELHTAASRRIHIYYNPSH